MGLPWPRGQRLKEQFLKFLLAYTEKIPIDVSTIFGPIAPNPWA